MIQIHNKEEFLKYRKEHLEEEYEYECGRCHQTFSRPFKSRIDRFTMFCRRCALMETNIKKYGVPFVTQLKQTQEKRIATNIKKYGVPNPQVLDSVKEKAKQTCQEKYGVDNPVQTVEVREKMKKTCRERYGSENPMQCPDILQKAQETNIKKYGSITPLLNEQVKEKIKSTLMENLGVNSPAKSPIVQEKMKKTCMEKYGTENPMQNKQVQEKNKQTCLQKYGVENVFQSEEIKEKIKKFFLEKYGVENISQVLEIKQRKLETLYKHFGKRTIEKVSGIFIYQDVIFDSSWELAFWIWCEDHNIKIEREPCYFEYNYTDGTHKYFPDFKLPCGIVEIKGDHFFDINGNFINPYDRNQNGLYQAKYQCMLDHNVIILRGQEIKFYISYIEKTYGNDYLTQFKNKKPSS